MKHKLWGILWREENKLDGENSHLIYSDGFPILFKTRKETRNYIKLHYGYIQKRIELRSEPHGWKMPIPIKVEIIKADGGVNG